MRLTREVAFGVAWRAALLLLPWQTRWFSESAAQGVVPAEALRVSVYASWVFLIATVALGVRWSRLKETSHGDETHGDQAALKRARLRTMGFGFLLMVSVVSVYIRATVQWWAEVLVLYAFVSTLVQRRVPAREAATWLGISLLPHLLLGLRQYQTQMVWGAKWLGIAAQDPRWAGVSVVEYDDLRLLRAYGGLPHPNIFGGWIALMIPAIAWRADRARMAEAIVWVMASALVGVVLIVSFSRAAWIAAIATWVISAACVGRRVGKPWGATVLFVMAFVAGIVVWKEAVAVKTRLVPQTRLEQLSVDERKTSVKTGVQAILAHPLLGTGPGTFVVARAREAGEARSIQPHVLPILAAAELGLVGMVGLVLFLVGSIPAHTFRRMHREGYERLFAGAPLVGLLILSAFDHYLWSFWAGKSLVACAVLLFVLPHLDSDGSPAMVEPRKFSEKGNGA